MKLCHRGENSNCLVARGCNADPAIAYNKWKKIPLARQALYGLQACLHLPSILTAARRPECSLPWRMCACTWRVSARAARDLSAHYSRQRLQVWHTPESFRCLPATVSPNSNLCRCAVVIAFSASSSPSSTDALPGCIKAGCQPTTALHQGMPRQGHGEESPNRENGLLHSITRKLPGVSIVQLLLGDGLASRLKQERGHGQRKRKHIGWPG
mmetsp:Transcript_54240/g.117279  ORF Transcript_54240/g.117279 Transcript_54240/m.117279 type:complete len:212 (+) Transcript_54240:103-738(+)|eukprot:CAMPEP_0170569228 /NCGR_PEP_ID=MMETSP0224-20130122/422_1 /TAXON_ID=285029 /ORGANISM="Togula jolla, Strain CCCM 725" /LENGTH=211 /DNA_ID=CAMNT_0010891339 /DNA_START=61 /DNA_END=696 /DNA_ORIENTATION=-